MYQVRCRGVCGPQSSDNRGVGMSGGQTSVAKEGSRVSSRVTLVSRICWRIQLRLLGWPRLCTFQVAGPGQQAGHSKSLVAYLMGECNGSVRSTVRPSSFSLARVNILGGESHTRRSLTVLYLLSRCSTSAEASSGVESGLPATASEVCL
jgi:hypothetical protein